MSDPPSGKNGTMNGFVIRRNIRNFERLLVLKTNAAQRRTLLELLAEEEAKLAELHKS